MKGQNQRARRQSRRMRSHKPAGMALQSRDCDIVVAIHQHKFLSRDQLQLMCEIPCVTIFNRLARRLYDWGFVDRQFLPVVSGSSQALYFLGKRGIPIVAERLHIDPDIVALRRKQDRQLKMGTLEHDLLVNDFRIALVHGLKGTTFSLTEYLTARECECRFGITSAGKEFRYFLRPDGYFELESNGISRNYFFEVDRSTSGLKKLRLKFQTYQIYRQKGVYKEVFRKDSFCVLVITKTAQRAKNLQQIAEKLDERAFYFTTVDLISGITPFSDIWIGRGLPRPIALAELHQWGMST